MKISDFILQYPSASWSHGYGICRVRLFLSRDDKPIALLTDLGLKNVGSSVTNAAESIIRTLLQRGYVTAEFQFIEHYEGSLFRDATFDNLSISSSGKAVWKQLLPEDVPGMLGCTSTELTQHTLKDRRLAAEIDRLRQLLNPRIDLPHLDSTQVIQRKLEIEASMLSRAQLQAAVQAGAGERELQRLIRLDLSLLGEVYAAAPNEYICFSEFPIGDGFVDFVVFTGRSRMEILLLEIKGAEFNLVNADNYAEFNAKVNTAAGQIRRHYRTIYESLSEFRQLFHGIRTDVEAGQSVFQSSCGAYMPLQVDPEKDINIYGVVIGGRMRDDLSESRQRHDYESHFTPPIRVDSWDSWLNRLQRE